MKKDLEVKNWMFPMPVLMIGTDNEDGTPDVMNAAWGGITLEDQITICFDTCQHVYRLMGEVTAQAFYCGKELM